MRNWSAVLILLLIVGIGHTGEKDIIAALNKEKGVGIRNMVIIASKHGFVEQTELVAVFQARSRYIPLAELCELRKLWGLHIYDRPLTVTEIQTVGGLNWLIRLELNNCGVTDAHLQHLRALRKLKYLYLEDTSITDAGLGELVALGDLEKLSLAGSAITDTGLSSLKRLSVLNELDLSRCPRITEAGIARFQKTLPECKIVR